MTRARWPVLGLVVSVWAIAEIASLFTTIGRIAALSVFIFATVIILAGYWLQRSWRIALAIGLAAAFALTLPELGVRSAAILVDAARLNESYLISQPWLVSLSWTAIVTAGLALWMGHGFAQDTARGTSANAAAFAAMRKLRPVALVTFGAQCLYLWSLMRSYSFEGGFRDSLFLDAVLMSAGTAIGLFLCFLFLPLLLGAIRPSESTVARFNRVSERRERWLDHLVRFAEPRWALSVTGVAVVLLMIVGFDYRLPPSPLVFLWTRPGLAAAIGFGIAGIAGALVMRDWRGFFACALPAAFAASFGAWLAYRSGLTELDAPFADYFFLRAWQVVGAGTVVGAGLTCAIGARIAAYRVFDAPLVEAYGRALYDVGEPMIAISLATAVLQLFSPVAPVAIISCIAALLLTPALLAVLESAFPRRKRVEQLYGKKRVEPS